MEMARRVERSFFPNGSEAIIAGIRDQEIAAFEKVYFASALDRRAVQPHDRRYQYQGRDKGSEVTDGSLLA